MYMCVHINSFDEHINTYLVYCVVCSIVVKSTGSEPDCLIQCQLCHLLACDLGQLT